MSTGGSATDDEVGHMAEKTCIHPDWESGASMHIAFVLTGAGSKYASAEIPPNVTFP
jgi:hypothetical protein